MQLDPAIDGVAVHPVRSPTLPPATHTNSWLLGGEALLVVDPASPWEGEQRALFEAVLRRVADGARLRGIFLTHHHHDHVSGAVDLARRLAAAGHEVPVLAHAITAELVSVTVDELLGEGDTLALGDAVWDVLHTPGHAPGHLCLHDRSTGALLAGDMVAGVGTIAIDPDEGDLGDYLYHLERLRSRRPSSLLPAHGPVLRQADTVLSMYVAHRHGRTEQFRALLEQGAATPLELAGQVYSELDPRYLPLAARQVLTHLRWLEQRGHAAQDGELWRLTG